MTKKFQIYKCEVCGNIVEILHEGVGELVCCGQKMKLLEPKTKEQGMEKHLPVVEKTGNTVRIQVGSVLHPMEDKHYIEWIEIQTDNKMFRMSLKPGDEPKAEFKVEEVLLVMAYCNIHGLWAIKINKN
ncbi:MAG: desulfoferrodoxin [Candidatus Altarchaeaceae archaeon]